MFRSQSILTFSNADSCFKLEGGKSISIYIKILINYSQMVGIIRDLQLKWPYYVDNFFNFTMSFGFISTGIMNFDCFVSDLEIKTATIYIKMLFSLAFYIFFIFGGVSFFLFRRFILKKHKQFNKFIMFFLILSIMIQPNSIKEGTDLFVCQKVGEQKSYLVNQMSEECYTSNHIFWVIIFVREKNYHIFIIDSLFRSSSFNFLDFHLSIMLSFLYFDQ